MFYIKFQFDRKVDNSNNDSIVENSFAIALSESERDKILAKLMTDPNVHHISVQEYVPVDEVLIPSSFNIEFEFEKNVI